MEIGTEVPKNIYTQFFPEALEKVRSGKFEKPIESWVRSLTKTARGEGLATDMERFRQGVQKALKFTEFAKPAPFKPDDVKRDTWKEVIILAAVKRIVGEHLEEFLAVTLPESEGMTYKEALSFVKEVESGGPASETIGASSHYLVRREIFSKLPRSWGFTSRKR